MAVRVLIFFKKIHDHHIYLSTVGLLQVLKVGLVDVMRVGNQQVVGRSCQSLGRVIPQRLLGRFWAPRRYSGWRFSVALLIPAMETRSALA